MVEAAHVLFGQVVGEELDHPVLVAWVDAVEHRPAFAGQENVKAARALEGNVKAPWGEMPAGVFVFSMFQDMFIHGWDLAKATGQDATLDPELVEMDYAIAFPSKDMIRSSGTFGPAEVSVAASADTQSKLLGMLGRQP